MSPLHVVLIIALLQVPAYSLFHKDVTASNFDKLVDPSQAHILMEFYAPWCGHCKSLAPEYEQLGAAFSTTPDVHIVQIDADKHKKLGKRFKVEGFPTLKWVQKGSSFEEAEDVNAERTADALLEYVNGKTGQTKRLKGAAPSSVTDITPESFSKISESGAHAFIGFFAPWCGHCKAIKPTWEELANLYADDDVIVGAVDCDEHKDLCTGEGVGGFPTLKFYTGADSDNYEKGRSIADLVTFINDKTGTDYAPDGGVTESAGLIDELSEHLGSYISASSEDERSSVVKTCRETVDGLDGKAGDKFQYYVKVFSKIAEKGIEYITTEKNRLTKVVETSESLKGTQRRSFMRRINVLNAFDQTA